jgi:regulator of replication initiation timing
LTSLTDHTKKLTDEVNAVRKRMSELYKTNKALSDELSSITQKLTEEIDAKTRAATAMKGAQ